MASITFTDLVTYVPAAWANDVNTLVYSVFQAAQNATQAKDALGLGSNVYMYATSQVMLANHQDSYVRMDSASANTYTVQQDSLVNMRIGSSIVVRQAGAGQTTIAAGSGVVISSPETMAIRKQNGTVTLIKSGVNSWEIEGNLA